MQVLVDTSVWIDYFRGGRKSDRLDYLIDENLVATNDLILAELVPPLRLRRKNRLISLLRQINRLPLNIDWRLVEDLQYGCLRKGINAVGIPDLIIALNAITHGCALYSLDKHFKLIGRVTRLVLL